MTDKKNSAASEQEIPVSEIKLWEYLSGKSTHDLSKDLIQIIFADRRFVEAIKYYIEYKVLGERGGYYWTDDELKSWLNELHLYTLIRKLCISIYEYREHLKESDKS